MVGFLKEKKTPAVEPVPAPAATLRQAPKGDGKATMGLFLRSLRKVARNGVLITLCMDLDGEYEDGVFVLYTTSDTVYRSLSKPEHQKLMAAAFESMGISSDGFALRLRAKQSEGFQKGVEEIKSTFNGIKIEIK